MRKIRTTLFTCHNNSVINNQRPLNCHHDERHLRHISIALDFQPWCGVLLELEKVKEILKLKVYLSSILICASLVC